MRVLQVDGFPGMRGGQWQVLRLAETLSGLGVESTLLAPAGTPLYELARRRGLRAEPLGMARLARLGRRHELVHAHDARSHTLAALAGGAPLVVSRRVDFAVGDSAASRWKYGRPRRYIAVSEFVKSVLAKGGVGAEKIDVVYDGVPWLEPAAPVEPPLILAADNRGDPLKGAALAVEAARLAGVEITFSGELERDLRRASLFVYLTKSEGLGSAVLLAMSAGVPVIASDVGGLKEAVAHEESGLLVENDSHAIARAIRRLLDDRDAAGRMGRNARQRVAEKFTIDNMARGTLDVYHRVLT
ncbi:MAG: glycosyltransferase family 4 protein [Bryobacteraceae bacterium]|jgi:glycosyltransferase involved in cell wall biosynthesis